MRRLGLIALSCAALVLHGAAQGTDFYQQLTVTYLTPVALTGAAGKSFCTGTVENAPVRFTLNGTSPTASLGQPAYVGDRIQLGNASDVRNFLVIASTLTNAVVNMSCGNTNQPIPSTVIPTATVNPTVPSVVVPAPSVVQQVGTDLSSCTPVSATAIINNQVTLTLTPPSGQFVYFCSLDLNVANNATGGVASTNLTFTSTNLGGWLWKFSDVGTANTTTRMSFVTPPRWQWRSQVAGTAVTIVSPAANAQATYNIHAGYRFGS